MEIKTEWTYHRKKQIGVGQGRNSTVYLVDDPQRGGEIVVKEIPKLDFRDPGEFFCEAQAMAAAEAPNVVPLFCASQNSDTICVAMPYFRNGSLADRIASLPLRPREVIKIAQDILNGLSRIHSKGFIHFDIKPTNVLFNDFGIAMVADFGQTRVLGNHGLTSAPPVYTFGIPPEVFNTGHGMLQSDIYQAGLTLYRSVNGDVMFRNQCPATAYDLHSQVLAGKFPNRDFFQPHVPKALRTIIRKAIKVDPAERYATAAEFADAVGRVKVTHDWRMEQQAGGGLTWSCERLGQPKLIVSAARTGANFEICLYTEASGKRRAKDTKKWKKDLPITDARTHLKSLFQSME